MPSRISLFFRRDRTKPGHSSADGIQKSKLKKRLSFFSSNRAESSQVATLARGNASSDNAPKLPRSIPASTTNVPELPSYPIYQSFNPTKHLSLLPNERLPDDASCSDRRPARAASVVDVQALRCRRSTLHGDAPLPTTEKLPAYDRAVELGKSYRSILPNFQVMCEEDEIDIRNGESARNLQQATQGQQDPCPRIVVEKQKQEESIGGEETHPGAHPKPPPDPTHNAPSVASSTTAVDNEERARIPTQPRPETENGPQPRVGNLCSLPVPTPPPKEPSPKPSPVTAPEPAPESSPKPSPEPSPDLSSEPTQAPPIPQRHRDRDRRSRITQHGTAGLQICTELLTTQLRKALSVQHQEATQEVGNEGQRSRDSERAPRQRLQVLLLIEAYEGVLRRCRREAISLALGPDESADGDDGGGGDAAREERRRKIGNAVPILEHWLDTLRAVHDGFGEGGEV